MSDAISIQTRMNNRVKELESAIGAQKERWEQQSKRDEEVISGLRREIGAGKDRAQQLMSEISTKEASLSQLQSQSLAFLGKIEENKGKAEQYAQKLAKSEGILRDLESKSAAWEQEKGEMERQSQGKEQRLKQLIGRVKSLEEEIWNKDSESMKKDGLIIKYSGQIDDLKKSLQQAHAKLRSAAADQLAEMSAILEKKEGEIALLKEMLRSAKIQAKGGRKKTAEAATRPTEPDEPRPI
jgi:chromosome segregation ATPase